MTAETKQRKFVHLGFDEMDCPVDGCTSLKGKPQHGKIPGVKRHVLAIHGQEAYDKVTWPPIRTVATLSALPKSRLTEAAKQRKVKGYSTMSTEDLAKALIDK